MGLEKKRIGAKVMKWAASGETAELHCASNEVEDTRLSPTLLCSLDTI